MGIELRPAHGGDFPAFSAGAHVDLHLPNGMLRSYSLVNSMDERHRYVIGVLRDPSSRGGSRCVHESFCVGMRVRISSPRNHFPLQESAAHSVLVAGGIGVTPLLCMARRLRSLSRPFELLYFARSRRSAAFLNELRALDTNLVLHFDDEQGQPPDLHGLLAAARPQPQTHYYACGPAAMLDAFQAACRKLGYVHTHIERFTPVQTRATAMEPAGYQVELRRSGRVLYVMPGVSLLDSLLACGIDVDHSCREGVCGTCMVPVLEGEPDHRDSVLMESQRAANDVVMACVSGSKGGRLVLDL